MALSACSCARRTHSSEAENLLHCICRLVARSGSNPMSALRPLSGANRKTFAHVPPLTRSGWKRGIIPPLHGRPPTVGATDWIALNRPVLAASRRTARGRAVRDSLRRSSYFPLTPYSTAKPDSLGFANLRKSEADLSISYCFISRCEWRWDLYRYQRCGSWLCGEPWETEAVRN